MGLLGPQDPPVVDDIVWEPGILSCFVICRRKPVSGAIRFGKDKTGSCFHGSRMHHACYYPEERKSEHT